MNERFRLPIAILVSLLLHISVLVLVMQLVKVHVPTAQGLMQVFLQQNIPAQERTLLLRVGTATPTLKNPQPNQVKKTVEIPRLPQSITNGRQASDHSPPAFQQTEQMNVMHLAQLAQQREMQRASVMAAMSNLAVQLRPVVKARIVCAQKANGKIVCAPEPDNKVSPLLQQFFSLAAEARQLGIADNPVHIDFGPEQSVSVMYLP